jgi:hypothetical protein
MDNYYQIMCQDLSFNTSAHYEELLAINVIVNLNEVVYALLTSTYLVHCMYCDVLTVKAWT